MGEKLDKTYKKEHISSELLADQNNMLHTKRRI